MRKIVLIIILSFILGGPLNASAYKDRENIAMSKQNEKVEKATFAGGCFWCMEYPFEKLDGVIEVISGYTGGHKINPTYEEVSSGGTGHLEAIQITYDPDKITYQELLDVYWRQIDPTDAGGSFVDRGSQYKSAIFYHSDEQKHLAEISKENLDKSGRYENPVVVEVLKYSKFYEAEKYHQDYYKENPFKYKYYRHSSGRDQYLKKIWGDDMNTAKSHFKKPSGKELEEELRLCNIKSLRKTALKDHLIMNTGIIKKMESMLISYPVSLFSVHLINMILRPAGQVLQSQLNLMLS